MALRKNKASQKIAIFVSFTDGGLDFSASGFVVGGAGAGHMFGKTGQATNLSSASRISLDGGSYTTLAGSWTELDSTNMPGVYIYAPTQAETNADHISIVFTPGTEATFFKPFPRHLDFETGPDWETNLLGPGHTIPGDTLAEIASRLTSQVYPVLRAGQSTTELSGSGWLSDLVKRIREWTDTPSTSAKFDPARMLAAIQASIRELFSDPAMTGGRTLIVRQNIAIVAGQSKYVLPAHVGKIVRIAKMSTNNTPSYEVRPGSFITPFPVTWTLEGNVLTLGYTGSGVEGDTLQMAFIPNGDIKPHYGTLTSVAVDGTTAIAAVTPTDGTLDTRDNSYAGYMFRILSATTNGGEQEVPISAFAPTTRTFTFERPLNPVPTGTIIYEVVPVYGKLFTDVLALHVARSLVASVVDQNRFQLLTRRYMEKARALRLSMSQWQRREATRFDGRNPDNEDYSTWTSWWGFM